MKVGIVIPSFHCEKRVALLPEDIGQYPDELIVEEGFGKTMGIPDSAYSARGCRIAKRRDIFDECDTIFALKLLQPQDYQYLREKQMIIGWVHPSGSGVDFMQNQVLPKRMIVCDLDNIYPTIYYDDRKIPIDFIPRNFLSRNSFYAGFSSCMHAFLSYGEYPDQSKKIAVLGNGNTSQGVFYFLSKFTDNIRMYYRKTIAEFKEKIDSFDVIINGIEMDVPGKHILTIEDIKRTKENCFIIDAAADAGNTIEGTKYTSIENPIYVEDGRCFYEVNNSPSLIYRTTSRFLSASFAKHIFSGGVKRFYQLIEENLITK